MSCSGPAAVYRCTVDEAGKIESYRQAKRVLQLVCITELAREGSHEQCRVRRSGPEGCLGQDRTVSLVSSVDALAAKAEAEAAAGAVYESETAIEPTRKPGPPKTVEELARRTASASKEQFQKTGNSVGDAMKKGWGCLTSLFKNC